MKLYRMQRSIWMAFCIIVMIAGAGTILYSLTDHDVYLLMLGYIALKSGAQCSGFRVDDFLPLNVTFEGKDE